MTSDQKIPGSSPGGVVVIFKTIKKILLEKTIFFFFFTTLTAIFDQKVKEIDFYVLQM